MEMTSEKHALRTTLFSCRGAYLCIFESEKDNCLYMSVTRSPEMTLQRAELIKLIPELDNKALSYSYSIYPGYLEIITAVGFIRITFENDRILRVFCSKISLKLCFNLIPFENASPTEDYGLEIAFMMLGKMSILPLKGAIWHNAKWIPEKASVDKFMVVLLPSVETGECETAIHIYYSNSRKPEHRLTFDESVREMENAFNEYLSGFSCPPAEYQELFRLSVWLLWIHMIHPSGILKGQALYESRTKKVKAIGWQQCLPALLRKDHWDLIVENLEKQTNKGQLPVYYGDIGMSFTYGQFPMLGFSLACYQDLYDEETYQKLSLFADWWTDSRDWRKNGIPELYNSAEDCFSDAYKDILDFPVRSPVLITALILLMDSLFDYACVNCIAKDTKKWEEKRVVLLKSLLGLWTENGFAYESVETGEKIVFPLLAVVPVAVSQYFPAEIKMRLRKLLELESAMAGSPLEFALLITCLCTAGEKALAQKYASKLLDDLNTRFLSSNSVVPALCCLMGFQVFNR